MRVLWQKDENWSTLKKAMERRRNLAVNLLCDEDTVTQMTGNNCLQRIGRIPITFDNDFPPGKQALLSHNQVKYVEYIIVTRETLNLGMSRREVIQMISDIRQISYYVQAETHLDYLIRGKRLPNMKRHGRVTKSQAMTTERLHIFVLQQYHWHMMIEAK